MTPRLTVIIPGFENLPLTRRCLRSLARHTPDGALAVIYVDNGSQPYDVAQLLTDFPHLIIVRLPGAVGFVRAVNCGMVQALMLPAPYLMWLNNDAEVTSDDWLDKLLAPFEDASVAAVGAVSDHVFGYQRREAPAPDGDWIDIPILIGFALALRRDAVQAVGLLDERFSPGNYEDWDYSLRLRAAGYRLILNEQVWVKHAMHATFGAFAEGQFQALLDANLRKLVDKWGADKLEALGVKLVAADPEPVTAEPLPAPAEGPAAVRLVTHATVDWMPRLQEYVISLHEHSPWENWLLVLGQPPDKTFKLWDRVKLLPVAPTAGSPERTRSLQHGSFLRYIEGPEDDVLIYTDGDIVLQRPPSADERALVERLPAGHVLAGYNSGPHETLALEASRLSPRQDVGTVFDGRLVAQAACYNIGVIAARRATWRRLHDRYMALYPAAEALFAHPARQQWLVCYVIAELGMSVDILPYSFHLHGCYALPDGAAMNGRALYHGEPVLFRHHLP